MTFLSVPGPRSAATRSTPALAVLVLSLVFSLAQVLAPDRAGAVPTIAPVNATSPTISGLARYGAAPLEASPGTWDPAPAGYGYQWLRDGAPIAGATGSSYLIVPADIGHLLQVRVTAHDSEQNATEALSAPTGAVQPGAFTSTSSPTITGKRRWGRTLKGWPGTWSPAPTTLRYQWLRDGRTIRGATGRRYDLKLADFGARITFRVTAVRTHYRNGVASARTKRVGHRVAVRKRFSYSISTRGRITTDVAQFARQAAQTYADPRGWRSAGYKFRRVDRGGHFTLVLAEASWLPRFSSACSTQWSCRVGRYVVINQERWKHASPAWNAGNQSLRDYRHMVVNHETGHWLGHGHRGCPGPGRLAPVMMQQSKGLAGCRFNPFPLPGERWTSR